MEHKKGKFWLKFVQEKKFVEDENKKTQKLQYLNFSHKFKVIWKGVDTKVAGPFDT